METFFKMLATVGSLWTDREGLLFLAGGHRVDLTASGHPGKTRLEGQGPSWQVGWMDCPQAWVWVVANSGHSPCQTEGAGDKITGKPKTGNLPRQSLFRPAR